jgi:O-antigen/teichoic acid export membrane protein
VFAVSQWGLLVALTKLLPVSSVGQYAYGVAIAAPLFLLFNFQLRSLQASESLTGIRLRDLLRLRWISSALALMAISGVAIALCRRETSMIVISVGLYKAVDAVADVLYGHLQRAERMRVIAVSMGLRGLLSSVALVATVAVTTSLISGLLVASCMSMAVLVFHDVPAAFGVRAHELPVRDVSRQWRFIDVARLGVPLALTGFALGAVAYMPRYFLERLHGVTSVGYFAALAVPAAALTYVVNAVGQSAAPRLAEQSAVDERGFRRTVLRLVLIPVGTGLVALILALLCGREGLAFLYKAEYAHYYDAFLVMLLAAPIWGVASVLGYAATSAKCITAQAPSAIIVFIVAAVTCAAAIPGHGLIGAAIGSVISGLAAACVYAVLLFYPKSQRAAEEIAYQGSAR